MGDETMTLTKAELADLLFEKVGFNKREAKDMVESFYRGGSHRATERGWREAFRFRKFSVAGKTAAARPQSKDRRGDSDYSAASCHFSRQPETEGNGGKKPAWKAQQLDM